MSVKILKLQHSQATKFPHVGMACPSVMGRGKYSATFTTDQQADHYNRDDEEKTTTKQGMMLALLLQKGSDEPGETAL